MRLNVLIFCTFSPSKCSYFVFCIFLIFLFFILTLLLRSVKLYTPIKHPIPSRSSHQRCSVRIGVLRNFAKFTGKHLCQSLFFNKVAALRPATLLKKRLWHRCFPMNFVNFLRTPFLQNISGRLLLSITQR